MGTEPPSITGLTGRESDVLEERRGGRCGWNRVYRVERGPYKDGTVQVALWTMRSGIDFVLKATGSKKGALS